MPGLKLYVAIWIGLVAATIVETLIRVTTNQVIASIILLLIFIAAGKAVTIALYYQHLRYESWRLAVLPIAGIVAVAMLGISAAYSLATGMW